ncbi:MAG TPA: hypothetical protein VHL57_05405, partial [Flavobacteriales bacterium]|nr:hypothetical protein [Flavobacteriales bacterium]
MKRTLLAATLSAAVLPALAQISVGGVPYGLRMGLDRTAIPTVHSAPFDAEAVAAEDAERESKHILPAYGRSLAVDADLHNAGTWTDLPNGDRVWRLRIVSDGALATELYYEDLFLPNDAALYLYDDAGEQLVGGFTGVNNKASGLFATAQLLGESCIVEYYEPHAVAGQGHFRIAKVGHAYRQVRDAAADACEVDVNCSEGANWTEQRDGVVRISVTEDGVQGWCTGSLVNNVEQNCRAFILTANHCGINPSADDYAQWKFYFKYQRPGCDQGTALAGSSLTGCAERGESNDNGGDSGSDFLLVEADDPIPNNFNPYWCGWDATGTGGSNGVCIHHPSGDEKKISTYTSNLSSSTWFTVPNTHWRVTWAGTANGHGVTEGGSSGSPLFNSAHRIIGTLTGGGSDCNSPSNPDLFGKMSYHWQSDPGPTADKLKNWLDPNSTGTLTMDGSYGPCGTLGVHDVAAVEAPGLYPNPAFDKV